MFSYMSDSSTVEKHSCVRHRASFPPKADWHGLWFYMFDETISAFLISPVNQVVNARIGFIWFAVSYFYSEKVFAGKILIDEVSRDDGWRSCSISTEEENSCNLFFVAAPSWVSVSFAHLMSHDVIYISIYISLPFSWGSVVVRDHSLMIFSSCLPVIKVIKIKWHVIVNLHSIAPRRLCTPKTVAKLFMNDRMRETSSIEKSRSSMPLCWLIN